MRLPGSLDALGGARVAVAISQMHSEGGRALWRSALSVAVQGEPGAARLPTRSRSPPELASYSAALLALPEVQELEKIAAAAPPIPEYDALLTA